MPPGYHHRGLFVYDKSRASAGFALFAPCGMPYVRLANMEGEEVHNWKIPNAPGNYGYLLDNGNLLVANHTQEGPQRLPAKGGQLLELDWQGNVVWEHIDHCQHHDFRRLPNGNTLYATWRLLTKEEEGLVYGGTPGTEHEDGIYDDVIREVDSAGTVVWEWDAMTDADPAESTLMAGAARKEYSHCNTVSPCANGDIIVNQRVNGMISRIDKATRKVRWSLAKADFGQQHDVQELENGNLLFFANGATSAAFGGPEVGSRIIEMVPQTQEIAWEYHGVPANSFYSWFVSGCQRMPNGNTLICEGVYGRVFEVTPTGDIVWDFAQPNQIDNPTVFYHGGYTLFRAYRYAADSPQIQGRLGDPS